MTESSREKMSEGDNPSRRGIFDCDDAYRTPVRADYERIFTSGMVVLDTNVLLNLYRSNERTRKDIFSVLGKLRDRLWIPHQVLSEFWRNRDLSSVRGHHRTKAKDACAALDKVHRSTNDALDRWLKDVHLSSDTAVKGRINHNRDSMARILTDLKNFIQEQAERDALESSSATHSDPVLAKLEGLLHGQIGEPFPEQKLNIRIQEAKERAEKHIPPGYEDFGEKPDAQAAGDYLLWAQLLDEAERRRCDVLLVTGDVKVDWWTPGTNQVPARPRIELAVELSKRADSDLYMLTPSQLLAQADEIFNLRVDERSVSDLATAENERLSSSDYEYLIRETLRREFPEIRVVALDEQIGRSAPTPIPDITLVHPNCRIGVEVMDKSRYVASRDLQFLDEMIKGHELQGILVVSSTKLSAAALQKLRELGSETGAVTAWVRLDKSDLPDMVRIETLKMSIENLINAATRGGIGV